MSSVEVEKRKRKDGGKTNRKIGIPRGNEGGVNRVVPPPPLDDEVEEFFAIVKRVRVALNYFQRRDGEPASKPSWSPSFEREDFVGVETDPGSSHGNGKAGLDLNSDPVSDGSDSG